MATPVFTNDVRDKDGTIEGCYVETHYKMLDYVGPHEQDHNTICFTFDDGPLNGQMRIHVDDLRRILAGDFSAMSQVADLERQLIAELRKKHPRVTE